jgi:hypothetical protein
VKQKYREGLKKNNARGTFIVVFGFLSSFQLKVRELFYFSSVISDFEQSNLEQI